VRTIRSRDHYRPLEIDSVASLPTEHGSTPATDRTFPK
jgi:hypothetical protein